MPGWGRRLHVIADWNSALLFRPDIVKIDLANEAALLLRGGAAGAEPGTGSTVVPAAPQIEERV